MEPNESGPGAPDDPGDEPERPLFRHPPWMVGVVLILAVLSAGAGLRNPVWLLIGSPFLIVLVIYVWVRLRPSG